MLSYDDAARILDREVDALPKEIFEDLNGGVNLLPDLQRSDDGRYVMGLYHNDPRMGRYIEIFYGSFVALYGDGRPGRFEKQLKKTLHHELTHHIESKAGDHSLEDWDEEQRLKWEAECARLETDSVLFYGKDAALPAVAEAVFRRLADKECPDIASGWASEEGKISDKAEKAAKDEGLALTKPPVKLADEGLKDYGAVLCMTLPEADELAERFPELDDYILCLGRHDIRPPVLGGWARMIKKLEKEAQLLIEELCAEN